MLYRIIVGFREFVNFLKLLGNTHTYLIVDDDKEKIFYIQSKLSRSVLKLNVVSMVTNSEIILGLPPAQACYIGYKYGELFDRMEQNVVLESRYGKYKLLSFERRMVVQVMDLCEGKIITLNVKELLLTKKIINNIDSTQAFHLGFLAAKSGANYNRRDIGITTGY